VLESIGGEPSQVWSGLPVPRIRGGEDLSDLFIAIWAGRLCISLMTSAPRVAALGFGLMI